MMYTPILTNHSIHNVTLYITYNLRYSGNSIAVTVMNSSDNLLFDNSSITLKSVTMVTVTNIAIMDGDRVTLAFAHRVFFINRIS